LASRRRFAGVIEEVASDAFSGQVAPTGHFLVGVVMRAFAIAVIMLAGSSLSSLAVVRVGVPNECSDRNALQDIAVDARLTAIQFYYKGLIQNLVDKNRQICFEAHVLMDDSFAVLNRTRALIEANCLPVDVAARIATEGLCP
jgi:hypothetical protein